MRFITNVYTKSRVSTLQLFYSRPTLQHYRPTGSVYHLYSLRQSRYSNKRLWFEIIVRKQVDVWL